MSTTDVIICGAGIGGLALARLLGDAGCGCLVVERRPQQHRGGGYMIDFFGPGFGAAEAMGLLPRLRELAHPIEEAAFVNRRGRRVAGLSYRLMSKATGGQLLSLMRGDLELALHESLPGSVELRFGCTVTGIEQGREHVTVALSDGSLYRAHLLVGADGIHSRVRELALSPEAACLRYLGFHAAAFTFADRGLAGQLAGRFVLTDTTDRLLGLYGVGATQVAVLAVHRSAEPATPPDPAAALRERYHSMGWLAPQVLSHCPDVPALYYDQVAQVELDTWHRGRVVLVGDACQAVSLLAGQGASLALAGAHGLAAELVKARDVRDALRGYQARLKPVAERRQAAGRRTAQWFVPSSRTRLMARRLALRAMRAPGLDRRFSAVLVGRRRAQADIQRPSLHPPPP